MYFGFKANMLNARVTVDARARTKGLHDHEWALLRPHSWTRLNPVL